MGEMLGFSLFFPPLSSLMPRTVCRAGVGSMARSFIWSTSVQRALPRDRRGSKGWDTLVNKMTRGWHARFKGGIAKD